MRRKAGAGSGVKDMTAAVSAFPAIDWAPVMVRDLDGTIRHWSPALRDVYGWSPDEARGQISHRLLSTIFPRPLAEIERELLRIGRVELELRQRHRNGKIVVVASHWTLQRNGKASPIFIVETSIDISPLIRKFNDIEQRYRALLESAPDAIVISDREGHILAVNSQTERMFGYARDQLLGKSVETLVPERIRATHSGHRRSYFAAPRSRPMGAGLELAGVRADGTEFPVEISLATLQSEDGLIVSAAIRDVSARKHAEDLLRQSEAIAQRNAELFESITTSMTDAVLLIDAAGQLAYANPAGRTFLGDLSGAGSADWQRAFQDAAVQGGAQIPRDDWPMMRSLRGHDVDGIEVVLRRPDEGTVCYVDLTSRPIRDKSGAVRGAVVIVHDATHARETERQLRQSQKMDAIGQLTGGIAHDFNNILTVITGTIDILAEGVADRPTLAAIARMIEEAAERGAALTRHLLAVARKQPLQPTPTDVNLLIADTIRLLRPALSEHIEIEARLEQHAWRAMVDPSQLSTAIINLAVNARDAMPNGGKVTLTTANAMLDEASVRDKRDVRPGSYVMVAVGDGGTGIPASIRDKVFEPFFTTKASGRGTGLGLSMVYGFVKQSGGHVELVSEEGRGTTVQLFLPRSVD